MCRSFVVFIAMCSFAAICTWPGSKMYALAQYEGSSAASDGGGWEGLGSLYALLSQQDAMSAHPLARKSVRSPSRRLRFGRRSDPEMPAQPPLDELDDILAMREVRTPVRLRFGRRSDETAVPHIFPREQQERQLRAPSMRLRFGRRSDNNMFLLPIESPQDVKDTANENRPQQQ